MSCRPAEVSKDALDHVIVHVTWRVHVQTHLVDCIGNLRPRECEILKGASDAAVERSIREWLSITGRCFWLRVDWSGRRFAVGHAGALEDVIGVLLLMKKEPVRSPLNLYAEEEVEGSEVLHRKGVV